MGNIKVFGHTPADTDSVCSPIAYAWYLTNIKKQPAEAVVGGEISREAKFVLDKFQISLPETINELTLEDKVIIMDTNNPNELLPGLENSTILEIIDHHKLSGLSTATQLLVNIQPVACTSTILWEMMKYDLDSVPENIQALMLSAILSDTLNLRSTTTTDKDIEAVHDLANRTNINIDKLSTEMFEAKSNLEGLDPKEIVHSDFKDFQLAGKKVRVSVLETTNTESAYKVEEALLSAIKSTKLSDGLDGFLFFIVDIVNSNATLLNSGGFEQTLATKAFGHEFDNNGHMELPGVVSRKKQIIPPLESAASSI